MNDMSYSYINYNNNKNISLNNNLLYNDVPIYSNFNLHTSKKSGTYNLLKKIKNSINEINNEIFEEKNKYENLKLSLFLTKLNEFNIESNLLEE